VAITTAAWVSVTLLTKPTDKETLLKFHRLIKPGGPGWKKFLENAGKDGKDIEEISKWDIPGSLLLVFLGCVVVYSALFSIGFWIYSNYTAAVISTATALIATVGLIISWGRLNPPAKNKR
jgi:hypothetical protein